MSKQKKFGLVFEEHLPENTPLYDLPISKGTRVAKRDGDIRENYRVLSIEGEKAECERLDDEHEHISFPLDELIAVAQFGEPIYPYLKPIDSICNAPDSELWHTLIQADNYHALQLLVYLYGGMVDCIYIDPPYNTGARDWKYNNDYVDSNDSYRHSKWLSFMQKRLKLAKKLMKPNGVLICAIDDNELNSLGMLLSELFSDKRITPVAIVHNPSGTQGNNFSYNNEFLYFVYNPNIVSIFPEERSDEEADVRAFMNGAKGKSGNYLRSSGSTTFYPIIVRENSVIGFGDVSEDSFHPTNRVIIEDDTYLIYPIDNDGVERKWLFGRETVEGVQNELFIKPDKYGLPVVFRKKNRINRKTVWLSPEYNAKQYGSILIKDIVNREFSFPKSLYAVKEAIKSCVEFNKKALILDFFAGSGTTLHAVNLLNAEDGGNRRCIMVTNNEVSEQEAKALKKKGLKPGDKEWEELGIAQYVTWPRTSCSIRGKDIKGEPLKGNYKGCNIPMSEGFKANAAFFKLGFLDKTQVALGRQFRELLPLLWMKAGARGKCPQMEGDELPQMLICEKNHFAVLIEEKAFVDFAEKVSESEDINMIYLVVDSDSMYREMARSFPKQETCQLYRDYLDNFRINISR